MKYNDQRAARHQRQRTQTDPFADADNAAGDFLDDKPAPSHTRDLRLCRQVHRVLTCTLAGDCGDEILQDLAVDSVMPAPNASRLLVNVYLMTLGGKVTLVDILARLAGVEPLLRREVARAIVRKRAPELMFNIIAPSARAGEEGGAP